MSMNEKQGETEVAGHTPGPFTVHEMAGYVWVEDERCRMLADFTTEHRGDLTDAEAHANASLFVGALDLLAVARDIAHANGSSCWCEVEQPVGSCILCRARAAIAKAEGREP